MTREEAIKKVKEAADNVSNPRFYEHFVDALVALKLLNLDEPDSIEERFHDVASCFGGMRRNKETQGLLNMLNKAGLRIVDARGVS